MVTATKPHHTEANVTWTPSSMANRVHPMAMRKDGVEMVAAPHTSLSLEEDSIDQQCMVGLAKHFCSFWFFAVGQQHTS